MSKRTDDLIAAGIYGYIGYKTVGFLLPTIKILLFLCAIWLMIVVPLDCAYMAITGNPSLFPVEESVALREQQDKEWKQQWQRERIASLTRKMRAGDLVAQTDLASDYHYNDDPSDDQQGMKLLIDAANRDCAKAQDNLAIIYWKKGDKIKARGLWVLAARGRKERTYGTGSYNAREKLKYFFPADYDSRWDSE